MDKRILNTKCIEQEKKNAVFHLNEIQHFSLRPDKGRRALVVKSGRGSFYQVKIAVMIVFEGL